MTSCFFDCKWELIEWGINIRGNKEKVVGYIIKMQLRREFEWKFCRGDWNLGRGKGGWIKSWLNYTFFLYPSGHPLTDYYFSSLT